MSTAFGALRKISLSLRASGLTILSFSSHDRRGRYRMTQGSFATRGTAHTPYASTLPELQRTPSRRSSQNSTSTRLGESYPYQRYLCRLVFPLAAFHPVVLIDVADVEPASTAHCVARLPVA